MVQNTRTTAAPKGSALVAFLFFTLFVAGAPVAIRMTYAELAPFSMAALRFGLAALILWGIVLYKHIPLPRGRALAGALLYGALTVGLAFLFINWGLVATPAGRASILMATIQLLSVFLSALHGVERITRRGLLGASLAVAGIAVTAASPANGQASLPHMAAILMGAGLSAEGGVLVKWFPPSPVVVTNAIGVTVGGAILGVASLVAGEAWMVPVHARTWAALAYLVLPVSVGAFLLYLHVVHAWSPTAASYGFVVSPLVTIVAASVLAGEEIAPKFLAGAVLVLAGAVVGALLPARATPAPSPASPDPCHDTEGRLIPDCG